ncbi:ComEC/Rec2 family competence protein [Gordonia sp. (in: high G+C Gram-positive bacteria)]|uniref:ComEC/Rec2 family competence protein n=1 Tax=Gordonia sp. (in: high G+C Gram-positive bacteria) TaxID=84139 RepID=UPI0039E63BBC
MSVPRLDLRLAVPAVGCWLITWLGISATRSALVAAILLSIGLLAAAGLALCGHGRQDSGHGRRDSGHGRRDSGHGRRRAGAAAIVLATAGLALGTGVALLVRIDRVDGHPLRQLDGATVTAVVSAVEDPRVGSANPDLVWIRARVHAVDDRVVAPVSVVVFATLGATSSGGSWLDVRVGQRVRALMTVRAGDRGLLAARLTARGPPTRVAAAAGYLRIAESVRRRFRDACAEAVGHREAGLLPGLVVGDTSAGEPTVDDQFRRAGLTHLLAVSGANFALIVGTVVLLIALVGGSVRVTTLGGIAVTVGFAVLVQLSPSVIRAAIMGGIGLMAMALARSRDAMPALSAAVVAALLVWPELAGDAGFAMSVVATGALIAWSPALRDRLVDRGLARGVAEAVAMATVAYVVTAPLIALISGRISLTAIVANVAVAPAIPVVTVLGAAAMVLAGLDIGAATALARLLVTVCEPGLWWILAVARVLGGSWAAIPAAPLWVLLVLALACGARAVRRSRHPTEPGDQYSPTRGLFTLVRVPGRLAAVRRPGLPGGDRAPRPRTDPRGSR